MRASFALTVMCLMVLCSVAVSAANQWDLDSARTYTVRPDGTGDYPTIQAAVDAVPDESIIELADGVYTGPGNRDIDLRGKTITIRSRSRDATKVILDVQGSLEDPHRGFHIHLGEGPKTRIEYLTIKNGYAASEGGRPAGIGGGVLIEGADVTLHGAIIEDGIGTSCGAAIAIRHDAHPLLDGVIFLGNSDLDRVDDNGGGGAVWVYDHSSGVFVDCEFYNNYAATVGGAISVREHSFIELMNCTLVANEAAISGGGIYLDQRSSAAIRNTIIAFSVHGEAICCVGGSSAKLNCCDLYGNDGGDWVGYVAAQYGSSGNTSVDPLFCNQNNGDLHLRDDSPFAVGWSNRCGRIGALGVGCVGVLAPFGKSIDSDNISLAPSILGLSDSAIRISFALDARVDSSPVRLAIYDSAGRLVRNLLDDQRQAGTHSIIWNGTDEHGRTVPSGAYFCKLEQNGATHTRQIVVVR